MGKAAWEVTIQLTATSHLFSVSMFVAYDLLRPYSWRSLDD